MRIKAEFQDGTKFDSSPGNFQNPEQTLYEIYANYKNDKKIKGVNAQGEPIEKSFKELKSLTIDF